MFEAGGDATSLQRADSGDDGTDPYILDEDDSDDAPPLAMGASEPAAIMDAEAPGGPLELSALPEAVEPPAGAGALSEEERFPEHYSSDDMAPRCLESLLREIDSPVEAREEPSSTPRVDEDKIKNLRLLIAAGASKLSELFPSSNRTLNVRTVQHEAGFLEI